MERRLRLRRRLLKPDGVMVVTIDEHEVHHLGMLLGQVFPEARIQMVTIVTNPSGVDQGGLSRVEEYAFFCSFGSAGKPLALGDDMLADEKKVRDRDSVIRWEQLLRAGVNSARSDRPRLFYPLLVKRDTDRLVRVGDPLLEGDPDPEAMIDGCRAAEDFAITMGRLRPSDVVEMLEIAEAVALLPLFDELLCRESA